MPIKINRVFFANDTPTVESLVHEKNRENRQKKKRAEAKDLIIKRRGHSGVEGKDFQLGSVISRENSKIWNGGQQVPRDYRYDKIMRNRSIGRKGIGMSFSDDSRCWCYSFVLVFNIGQCICPSVPCCWFNTA